MDVENGQIAVAQPPLSKELQGTLERTHKALQAMWEREKIESDTTYTIKIPAQTLTLTGKQNAEQTLATLKSLRVSGSYRVTKGG